MANIDRIVNVQISLRTAGVQSVGFSDLCLFGPYTSTDGSLVNIITDPDQLINEFGVETSDPLYQAALVFFAQIPHPPRLYIGKDAGSLDPITDLAALYDENHDWYAICDVTHSETRATTLAGWVEGHEKLFVTVLHDPANLTAAASDVASTAALLKTGNFFRTAWWYHPTITEFPDVAACAKLFTKYPGQETWANQRLSSVDSVAMSETNFNNVFAKNGNTFEPFRNIAITQNGKVAGGEWIDIIRFRDWLCEEIKVNIFQQLVDNRIPYTDHGIAIIRTRLAEALDRGVIRGGIAPPEVNLEGDYIPSYNIQVPLAATISPNQKATRVLQDVYFTARIAGAIHVVEIQGTLTYENLPVGSPDVTTFAAGRSGQAVAMGV
jgi:hypothetical protein